MKRKLAKFIFLILFGIVIISCKKNNTDLIDITDHIWELKYLKVNGDKKKPEIKYLLEFKNDSLFMMDFSVNAAGGFYQIRKKGEIEFSNYHAFTEKCCDNDFDRQLSTRLVKTSKYEVIGDELFINGTEEEWKFIKNQ